MNVTFSCGGRLVPASRFRVDPIADYLKARGHQVRVIYGYGRRDAEIRSGALRKLYRTAARLLRAARSALVSTREIFFVQRLAIPLLAWPEVLAAKRGAPLLFDFDDAIFLGSNAAATALRRAAFEQVCRSATLVVAGNAWLAGHVPAGVETHIIPTCIDTDLYHPRARQAEGPVVVGWMGTGTNLPGLEAVVPAIQALRGQGVPFRFLLCSDERDEALIARLGAEFRYWSKETELETLQSFDIGLMPLKDDEWSKGKCSFKIVQYMATGTPAVASAVGFNVDAVADGETGTLVPPGREWTGALQRLIEDDDLRGRMGRAARERALTMFDVRVAERRYEALLAAAAAQNGKS